MHYEHIWRKSLSPNETVEYEFSIGGRYRMLNLIGGVAIGVLTLLASPTIGLLLIGLSVFSFGFYLRAANAYAFTNGRILVHRGWLSTKLISTDYSKITDITVNEPFLHRIIFQTGSIEIVTAGTNREKVILANVEHPYKIKAKLDELRQTH